MNWSSFFENGLYLVLCSCLIFTTIAIGCLVWSIREDMVLRYQKPRYQLACTIINEDESWIDLSEQIRNEKQ